MKKALNKIGKKKKVKESEEKVDFKTYNPEINKGVFTKKNDHEAIHTLSNDSDRKTKRLSSVFNAIRRSGSDYTNISKLSKSDKLRTDFDGKRQNEENENFTAPSEQARPTSVKLTSSKSYTINMNQTGKTTAEFVVLPSSDFDDLDRLLEEYDNEQIAKKNNNSVDSNVVTNKHIDANSNAENKSSISNSSQNKAESSQQSKQNVFKRTSNFSSSKLKGSIDPSATKATPNNASDSKRENSNDDMAANNSLPFNINQSNSLSTQHASNANKFAINSNNSTPPVKNTYSIQTTPLENNNVRQPLQSLTPPVTTPLPLPILNSPLPVLNPPRVTSPQPLQTLSPPLKVLSPPVAQPTQLNAPSQSINQDQPRFFINTENSYNNIMGNLNSLQDNDANSPFLQYNEDDIAALDSYISSLDKNNNDDGDKDNKPVSNSIDYSEIDALVQTIDHNNTEEPIAVVTPVQNNFVSSNPNIKILNIQTATKELERPLSPRSEGIKINTITNVPPNSAITSPRDLLDPSSEHVIHINNNNSFNSVQNNNNNSGLSINNNNSLNNDNSLNIDIKPATNSDNNINDNKINNNDNNNLNRQPLTALNPPLPVSHTPVSLLTPISNEDLDKELSHILSSVNTLTFQTDSESTDQRIRDLDFNLEEFEHTHDEFDEMSSTFDLPFEVNNNINTLNRNDNILTKNEILSNNDYFTHNEHDFEEDDLIDNFSFENERKITTADKDNKNKDNNNDVENLNGNYRPKTFISKVTNKPSKLLKILDKPVEIHQNSLLTKIKGDETGVRFEKVGRWFFRTQDNLPKPPVYENIPKSYPTGAGTFIDYNFREGSIFDELE